MNGMSMYNVYECIYDYKHKNMFDIFEIRLCIVL